MQYRPRVPCEEARGAGAGRPLDADRDLRGGAPPQPHRSRRFAKTGQRHRRRNLRSAGPAVSVDWRQLIRSPLSLVRLRCGFMWVGVGDWKQEQEQQLFMAVGQLSLDEAGEQEAAAAKWLWGCR
ncbi:hypothetical protein B296_00047620 [Ensete ventricosum]|uniref:Uncharacterized protein n=1 Tax=Ensete ventricosum TaxID=4639 RepID=A0A426YYJ7_ENSVE|nr:hypothetical protein B296_00047620 [Ensete ventricosum]